VGALVSTKLVELASGVPLSSIAAPPFEDRYRLNDVPAGSLPNKRHPT
jgi:hypothetical protein